MTDRHDDLHDDILNELWDILDLSEINVLELLDNARARRAQHSSPRLVIDNTPTDEGAFPSDSPFEPPDPKDPPPGPHRPRRSTPRPQRGARRTVGPARST